MKNVALQLPYTLDFCSDLSRVRLKKSDFVLLLYFSSLLYSSSLRLWPYLSVFLRPENSRPINK